MSFLETSGCSFCTNLQGFIPALGKSNVQGPGKSLHFLCGLVYLQGTHSTMINIFLNMTILTNPEVVQLKLASALLYNAQST